MKTCNRKILELFYNAKHTGRISKPDAIGRVGEDDDGLVIELTWRVIGGVIAEAKFRAFANPNAIAITSLMVDNMIGKSVEDALSMGEDIIIDNLGEFLPEYLEVYDMVRECIADAYNSYLKRQNRSANTETVEFDYEEYRRAHNIDEDEEIDFIAINKELQITGNTTEIRGRGRPRKPVDLNAVVEVGEKRGRGRPRKIVDETEIVEVGEKRGRGRPRKEIDPNAIVVVGEKRGRGRPRKERPEVDETVETEKRGRGRPRKIVDETEIAEVGEKRGRGRPRKEVDPNQIIEVGEKRGRGRPRKERPEVDETTETVKRGRGRPRKIVDDTEIAEVGEKRGRGRPRKEIKYNFPTDLDEVINDEEIEQLISGEHSHKEETANYNQVIKQVDEVKVNDTKVVDDLDEDDDLFGGNYDLFKSNIRNILSGKDVNSQSYGQSKVSSIATSESVNLANKTNTIVEEDDFDTQDNNEIVVEDNMEEVKRGRGRPRKEVDLNEVEEEGEKRGRGRPRKVVDESAIVEVGEKRGRGRPRLTPINSLTRSLSPSSMASHTAQDIVFASKNVTTTNININVTKTSTSIEDNKATTDDYTHTATISQQKVEVSLPRKELDKDEEIEIEPVKLNTNKDIDELEDDFDEDIDTSKIKDEAPVGGLEDLLKALLDD